jgi:uncharacterized protein YxjI
MERSRVGTIGQTPEETLRYVLKEKIWSWGDDFRIRDESGRDVYYVDGKVFSFGDKLSFKDMAGHELALIDQKLLSIGPAYEIYRGGRQAAVVKKKLFTLLRTRFTVDVPGPDDLEAVGDFIGKDYTFVRGGREVARVSKKWFRASDTYGVEVSPGEDDVLILASCVVIDLCVSPDDKNRG